MSENKSTKQRVRVHYIKSESMSTVYADGAYGGVTPRGMLSVSLYNERSPIPQEQEIKVDESGELLETRTTKSREGIIRSVDCTLMLTPEAARSLGMWLVEKAELALKIKRGERPE